MKRLGIKTFIIFFIFSLMTGCAALKNNTPRKIVPIAINVESSDPQLSSVNLGYYTLKVVDRLEDFNEVDLDLVDEPDSAAILLNIVIDRFTSFPPEQRVSRRVFRRSIQAGTDQNGRALYQTITATADLVQSRIRTSAFFNTSLTIKGSPGKEFKRSFSENMNIDHVYVTNIQGDTRALDPSVYTATMPPMEPITDDIVFALSNREMLGRLSREIRSYYSK